MSLAEAFAKYLQDTLSVATIGQDLFIGQAPSSNKVPDAIYWIQSSGGSVDRKLATGGKMKKYLVEIRYRDRDYQTVYDNLQTIEIALNERNCVQLDGFDTIEIEATTFPIDNDLDGEGRKVGMIAVTVTIYKT